MYLNKLEHSRPQPIFQPSLAESTETEKPLDIPLFQYMTGARANQFKGLYERGILDAEGNLTPLWKNFRLPPLHETEVLIIKKELTKLFIWKIDEKTEIELSIGFLIRLISKKYSITSKHLIGGYVTHLLMKKTNYAERVFSQLGVSDLYDQTCYPHADCDPADIDLRLHITNIAAMIPLEKNDFLGIQAYIASCLTERYVLKNQGITEEERSSCFRKVFDYFLQHPPIISGRNRFLETSFKDSPVDCVLYNDLARTYVFTLDDLYLPVESLFEKAIGEITPQSHRGEPLESFLHVNLGLIKTKRSSEIDIKGWFRYIGALTKGNYSAQKTTLEDPLENQLFRKMFSVWFSQSRESGIVKLNLEIGKWIKKHYENNPEVAFAFILTAAHHLESYLDADEIKMVMGKHLADVALESTAAREIQIMRSLLLDDHLPISVVLSLLQLAGFLNASREGTPFTIVSEDFHRPALQCTFNKKTIQLRLAPENALNSLLAFKEKQADCFEKVEKKLSDLFFSLYQLNKGYSLPNTLLVSSLLSDELLTLGSIQNVFPLLESESLFLKHAALLFIIHLPFFDERAKVCLAAEHFHKLLPGVEEREELSNYYAQVLGMDAIPSSHSTTFMEDWITALLAHGRLQGIGYSLWKSAIQRKEMSLPFSIHLIHFFSLINPDISVRLFSYLKKQQLLDLSHEGVTSKLIEWSQTFGHTQEHQRFQELAREELAKIPQPVDDPMPPLIEEFEALEIKPIQANQAENLLEQFKKGKANKLKLIDSFISLLESAEIASHQDLKEECLDALISLLKAEKTKLSKNKKKAVNKIISRSYSRLSKNKTRREILKLCETKGFSIETKAGVFWLNTLQDWILDSPHQVKLINRLYKEGIRRSLYSSSHNLAIKLKLHIASIVEHNDPIKMELIENLIEEVFEEQDIQLVKKILIELLGAKRSLVKKCQLLNRFLERKPQVSAGDIDLAVVDVLSYLQESKQMEQLVDILLLPSFCDAAWQKPEAFKQMVTRAASSLVNQAGAMDTVRDLTEHYFADITDAEFWLSYLNFVIEHDPQSALDPFYRVFNAKYLENCPQKLQEIYCNLLHELTENNAFTELSFFASNYGKIHEVIFRAADDGDIPIYAHCLIIKAIAKLLITRIMEQGFDAQTTENFELYFNAMNANLLANNSLIDIVDNPSYQDQLKNCLMLKEEADLLLIEMHFRIKKPEIIRNGCAFFTYFFESKIPPNILYPSSNAWPIVEALCIPMEPQPLEELDILLGHLNDETVPDLKDFQAVCAFLLKHPTSRRLERALDIWFHSSHLLSFLDEEKGEKEGVPNQSLLSEWNLFLRLADFIFDSDDSNNKTYIIGIINEIYSHRIEFFNQLNEEAKLGLSTLILGKFSRLMTPNSDLIHSMVMCETMNMLDYLKHSEKTRDALEALSHGLASLAIFDYDEFMKLGGQYQLYLSTGISIKGAEELTLIPKKDLFVLRKRFIEAILDVAANHPPFKTKLIEYAKQSIGFLIKEFQEHEFKQGISELFMKLKNV